MKEAKTIIVTCAVIGLVLLVAGLGYKTLNGNDLTDSQTKQALAALEVRIGQLTVMREEQTLTRDIMLLQQEIKQLNLLAQPEELPEEIQE